MNEVVDLLISHQRVLTAVIAAIGAGIGLWIFKPWTRPHRSERGTTGDAAPELRLTARTTLVAATAIAFSALAAYWTWADKTPIAATAALTPPAVLRASPQNTRLLVLVHGWNGDAKDTWMAFPTLIQSDSSFSSFDVWSINYPTFQLRRNLSIDQMARWLNETMVRDGYYAKYQEIYVIAHSMGGLVAREMLLVNRLGSDNRAYKSLIEIATPHQGAELGGLLNALGLSRGFSDDLRPGSPMLRALHEKWNALKDRPPTYCLSSPHDDVVTQDSAVFQCDDFLHYPEWGHKDMVKPAGLTDDRYRVPTARVKLVRDRPNP